MDELKVDRSFVAKLGRNYEDTTLISLMVIPAYSLGLKVVAEGVEKYYQLRPLRELGCVQEQGYYLSKPLPSHAMSAKLRLWRVAVVLNRAYLQTHHHHRLLFKSRICSIYYRQSNGGKRKEKRHGRP